MNKGEIYLARLHQEQDYNISKTRPVLIFQNDLLNRAVDETIYRDVTVIPLSTHIISGSYRFHIRARDRLRYDCDIVCNALCTISIDTLLREESPLTSLKEEEIHAIETILLQLFDIGNS